MVFQISWRLCVNLLDLMFPLTNESSSFISLTPELLSSISCILLIMHSFSLKYSNSLISLLFLPWPTSHSLGNCAVFMSLHAFCCFCFCWYPALTPGGLIGYGVLFQFSVEICFVTKYMVSFGEDSMRYWDGVLWLGKNLLQISVRSVWVITSVTFLISLLLAVWQTCSLVLVGY